MIQQPELGKKIAEYRKAKGLTQEELVELCNLNVRTLQRIESGEVMPRAYTLKLIVEALELNIENSFDLYNRINAELNSNWLKQFYIFFIGLFNLKTNKMKKITILSVMFILLFSGIYTLSAKSKTQKAEDAKKTILEIQDNINRWVKEGKIDSVMTAYRSDAKYIPYRLSVPEIRDGIISAIEGGYEMLEFETMSLNVADSIAVQTYFHIFRYQGNKLKQKGMTEWHLTNGKWLIVNDIAINY